MTVEWHKETEHGRMDAKRHKHTGVVWHMAASKLATPSESRRILLEEGEDTLGDIFSRCQAMLETQAAAGANIRGTVVTIGLLFSDQYWSYAAFLNPAAIAFFVSQDVGIEFSVYRWEGDSISATPNAPPRSAI